MTQPFIFFPFTHIPQDQLDTMVTFFPSFRLLAGSRDVNHQKRLQDLYDQGKITPFFPSPDEHAMVELKVEQYLEWARIHKGDEVNLRLLLKQTPYFTSDSDVTAIKSQVRAGQKDPATDESSLEKEWLFLKMAQLCDEQNEGIDLTLKNLDKERSRLMSELRGLENPPEDVKEDNKNASMDFGAVMTRERIQAWSRCMAAAGGLKKEGDPCVFFTTSKAVFDYLESNCKDVVNALDIDTIKVHENECENRDGWHHQFCELLMDAVQAGGNRKIELPRVDDRCDLSGQIKLSLFSGNDMNQLFNCTDRQVPVCLIRLKG